MADFDNKRFDELAAFVAVAREGSFARAGRSLHKHPTIISKRIASLEGRLGTRLIERTTRQVHLTDAGLQLVGRIQFAFETIAEAESEASATSADIKGHLRVAFPGTMGRLWLAPLIPRFLERHPLVTLEVDYSDRFVDLVADGYDVALRAGTLKDSALVARKLCVHRRRLAAAPAYADQFGLPSHPRDLQAHACLLFSGFSTHPVWFFKRDREAQRVTVSGRLTSNDSESLLAAARSGLGIMAAGEWLLARDIEAGTLIPVLPDWEFDADGAIHTVRPSLSYPPARTEAFVDWLADIFAHGPPWARPTAAD